jgi:4-hydroxy 2-oxovalerate aldolase
MSLPKLLECTLRDGSYAVDFQFTKRDTEQVCRALDSLGFPYIEVGHGVGIGASRVGPPAAATDLDYAAAAQDSVLAGKWGMFAIHGVAAPAQIRSLQAEGMSFVRIGIEMESVSASLSLVEAARDSGLEVFVNLMKSYTQKAETVGRLVPVLESAGASGVYLVDSAGGMLPSELADYVDSMLNHRSKALLGFHGHDNLGLAVAHSLTAALQGFDVIDCTMQGLGRSAGNASTERLVAILSRLGESRYDVAAVSQTSEELIRPKIPRAGYSGLDTFAGYSLFHSSYLPRLLDVSRRLRVDPYMLMQEHCAIDRIDARLEDLEYLASRLMDRGDLYERALPPDTYSSGDQ